MDKQVKEITDHILNQARKYMRQHDGKTEPKMYFLILYPGQTTPVYFAIPCSLFFRSQQTKQALPYYAQMCWYKKKAGSPPGIQLVCVCVVSDARFTTFESDTMPDKFPENDPKERECIMMAVCFPERTEVVVAPYDRSGKKVSFVGEPYLITDRVQGLIASLFPKNL